MSLVNQFIKSLYSSKDMALVRFQKVWKNIIYILLLSLIATIPISITTTNILSDEIYEIEDLFTEQIPDFTLADGKLTSVNNQSVINEGINFTFIFDPTITELDTNIDDKNIVFALLEDKLIFNVPGQPNEALKYSNFEDATITKDIVLDWLDNLTAIHSYVFSIVFIITFIITTIMKFISVSVFACFLPLIASTWKKKLTYVQSWNLMASIITIPTIFFCVTDALEIYIPYATTLQTFIIFVLMYIIIRELPERKKNI